MTVAMKNWSMSVTLIRNEHQIETTLCDQPKRPEQREERTIQRQTIPFIRPQMFIIGMLAMCQTSEIYLCNENHSARWALVFNGVDIVQEGVRKANRLWRMERTGLDNSTTIKLYIDPEIIVS